MGVLDQPLPTDIDDNTQTADGAHAAFHNDVNDAVNRLDVAVEELQIMIWMEP